MANIDELIGKQAEVSFEERFGKLADIVVREHSPSLMPYRVGFELLDNEDDKKAIGVYAFIVNDVWLYVPLFFLEGQIKGKELMFVKNIEMFCPAKDKWVQIVQDSGPRIFGDLVSQKEEDQSEETPVDEGVLADSFPYAIKTAAYLGDDRAPMAMFRNLLNEIEGTPLLEKVAELGARPQQLFLNTITEQPEFANALFRFYTPDSLKAFSGALAQKVATEAEEKEKDQETSDSSSVKFIDDYSDPAAEALTDKEKRVLASTGVFIEDKRKEVSRVYDAELKTGEYGNPSETGLYKLLMVDGSEELCLVVKLADADNPCAGRAVRGFDMKDKTSDFAVVSLKNPKVYKRFKGHELFGVRIHRLDDDIPKNKMFGYAARKENLTKAAGSTGNPILFVKGIGRSVKGSWRPDKGCLQHASGDLEVVFTGKDGKLSVVAGALRVPEGTRIFRNAAYKEAENFSPGGMDTVQRLVFKEAGLQPVSIQKDGRNYRFQARIREQYGDLTEKEALRSLVERHGIFAGQARFMLKEAARKGVARFLVKYAAPYAVDDIRDGVKNAPAPNNVETEEKQESKKVSEIMPQEAVQQAARAAEQGNRSVFDTVVLSSLVKAADPSQLRKDDVSHLFRHMDRAGRLLFLLYWHREMFENRYGKDDLFQLEQDLLNLFDKTGEIVLFLTSKQSPDPDTNENILGQLSDEVGETGPDQEGLSA